MEHTVSAYEQELKTLDAKIAQMGGLCEQLLAQTFEALEKNDPSLAEEVIAKDKNIDRLEHEIEDLTVHMIARRQPVAVDLRQIITAIRIAGDLERIGDLGKNISKRTLAIAGEQQPKRAMLGLKHMGLQAMEQLKDVLDAYASRDVAKAKKVWANDNEIDSMYNSLFRELLTYMMEDPRNITLCTHLLFGAKNIERIGDHVTNIAEMAHFMISGESLVEGRPKADTTSLMSAEDVTESSDD
ncbi:MAG: phosphate signaling complex protein PhoU, partial [Dichotomicrobium sp.]